jgi:hypothetical protein
VLTTTTAELGQLPTIATMIILVATVATIAVATVQPCSYPTATAGCDQSSTIASCINFPSFNFGKMGHFARECRQTKQSNSPRAPTPMVNQQTGQQRGPAPQTCCANYTTVDEIPTRDEVLASMLFLNEHPIIILFDSGASHDFMSSTYVKKAKLSLVASGAPYVISTPGGQVDSNQIVQKVLLELSERIFSTNLIIQSGQGIDVILGMSYMKMHRPVLDIAGRLVHLDSPV